MPTPQKVSELSKWLHFFTSLYGGLLAGLMVFGLLAVFAWWQWPHIEKLPGIKPLVSWMEKSPKPNSQADDWLAQAEKARLESQNEAARAAFGKALALYHEVGDRLGQANVQLGLGDLERMLGR